MDHKNIENAAPPPSGNTEHEEDYLHHHHKHDHVFDLEMPKKPTHDGDHDDATDARLESLTRPRHGDHGHRHDDGDDANDVRLESSTKPRHGDDGHSHDDDVHLELSTKPRHGDDGHSHDDGNDDANDVRVESSTEPRHDDDCHSRYDGDDDANDVCVESSTEPRHGDDDHSHDDDDDDDDVDLESPAKPTQDGDDDNVVDLESAMEGEGGCNSLTVVDSQFCCSTAMDLVMASNGRFRGRKYSITKGGNDTDENRELLLQLDQPGCSLNLMDKYSMVDHTNRPVLCIKQTVKGFLRNERQVFHGHEFKDGEELFRIQRSKFIQLKTSLDVYLQTNINQDNHGETIQKQAQHPSPDYVVKVNWLGSSFDILHGRKTIAQVRRKSTGWLRKKTFSFSLEPEVDYSFVVAMAIIADSIYKEHTLAIFVAIIDLIAVILAILP